MNILKLEKVEKQKVYYLYQPEGKGDCGEVVFDLIDKTSTLSKRSPMDTENNRYANKAMSKIHDFVESNNLPIEYTQAWY